MWNRHHCHLFIRKWLDYLKDSNVATIQMVWVAWITNRESRGCSTRNARKGPSLAVTLFLECRLTQPRPRSTYLQFRNHQLEVLQYSQDPSSGKNAVFFNLTNTRDKVLSTIMERTAASSNIFSWTSTVSPIFEKIQIDSLSSAWGQFVYWARGLQ
jgi:hypothetical protein